MIQTKSQRGIPAPGQDGGKQILLLRRHLGKTIQPEMFTTRRRRGVAAAQRCGGGFEKVVAVLQPVIVQPRRIRLQQQREVVKLFAQLSTQAGALGLGAEFAGGHLMLLQFIHESGELVGKTRATRAAAKKFQSIRVPEKQGAQNHDPAFIAQELRRGDAEFIEDKLSEPLEGKDPEAGIPGQRRSGQQLAFKLESGLFGRQQNERRAVQIFAQGGTDFRQTAKRLAAAGGAGEKLHLHARCSRNGAVVQSNLCDRGRAYLLFPFTGFDL